MLYRHHITNNLNISVRTFYHLPADSYNEFHFVRVVFTTNNEIVITQNAYY